MTQRGRPPKGMGHVDKLDGSEHSKDRLKVILATVTGEKSVREACQELNVGEAHFNRLREKALGGALAALEPGRPGRPPNQVDAESAMVEALEAELQDVKIDLRAAQIREEIALLMPHLLRPKSVEASGAQPAPKKKRRHKRRKQRK